MTLFTWTKRALRNTNPPHSGNWLLASGNTKRKFNKALHRTRKIGAPVSLVVGRTLPMRNTRLPGKNRTDAHVWSARAGDWRRGRDIIPIAQRAAPDALRPTP